MSNDYKLKGIEFNAKVGIIYFSTFGVEKEFANPLPGLTNPVQFVLWSGS
jgi:hypothetical protein